MNLNEYLAVLREDGHETLAGVPGVIEDYAIALWIREHQEETVTLLARAVAEPGRGLRIAAMLATYHEKTSDSKILCRLGGLIAGAVFEDLRKAVESALKSS